MDAEFYLQLAENEAWKYQGVTYPNPAVGCCVVSSEGAILAVEAHHKAGLAHAEVNALAAAYVSLTHDNTILKLSSSHDIHDHLIKNHNNIFSGCTLYVTLEPCSSEGKTPSCAQLIQSLQIKNVIIGMQDVNPDMANGVQYLDSHDFLNSKSSHHLIQPFYKWQQKNFVTFKWAQRLDGTIDETKDGSKIISSYESRKYVHKIRDVSDLIVIGGNTLREDNPILDARLVDGKAPDVLIFTRDTTSVDRNANLFHVEGRQVHVASDFKVLREYKNILIEGGPYLFELSKHIVDYYLCFVSLKSGGRIPFIKEEVAFELLHHYNNGFDNVMWLKINNKDNE